MRIALIHNPITQRYSDQIYQTDRQRRDKVEEVLKSAIIQLGHEVICLASGYLLIDQLGKFKPDIVFYQTFRNSRRVAETAPLKVLEQLRIPYTGSPIAACKLALDKARTKSILQSAGIPTPRYVVVEQPDHLDRADPLSFPLFIKPTLGGASLGISDQNPVYSAKSLEEVVKATIDKCGSPVLVEEFLTGREFTVGLLGSMPVQVLPMKEFIFHPGIDQAGKYRSYQKKMDSQSRDTSTCPADLSQLVKHRIENLSVRTFNILGCTDYGRVDIRCDCEGAPNVLEVNVHPSLLPDGSSFAQMALTAGINFPQLIGRIIQSACCRHQLESG